MEEEILRLENIQKSFKKHHVLKGVNFSIKKGESVALVGVNGAGKSTLFEIICKVLSADSGNVFGIKDYFDFGYMPQIFRLFSDLTIKENLEYFALIYKLDKKRVEEILNLCYLKEKENFLCSKLSGGYKQLVSLAVALIHNPPLLILDEPTSAMDPLFRDGFWKIINKYLKDGGSVLVTTHYMEEINFCNRLMILSSGKIMYDNFVKEAFGTDKNFSAMDLINKFAVEDKYDK